MLNEDYLNKVAIIAKTVYEIEEEVLLSYADTIEKCYAYNYTPRRAVEAIAENLFG